VTTREAFLARVRREVARTPGLFPVTPSLPPADPTGRAAAILARARGEAEPLLARFRAQAERVGAGVHRVGSAAEAAERVAHLAAERGVRRVATWARGRLGPAADAALRLTAAGLEVFEGSPEEPSGAEVGDPRPALFSRLAGADLGLTTADLAIAETGSLVLASGPGKGRAVSLLPPCHVAVVTLDRLVGSLEDAAAVLEARAAAAASPADAAGANVVLVTGPSRTADIELTLTRGVHGPREVQVVFTDPA
jgi:L-lactate dehydrogenase complex protein LldG